MSESTSPNLLYINKGKFGSIGYVEGSSFAFKTIHTDSELHREQLWKEFWMYVALLIPFFLRTDLTEGSTCTMHSNLRQ